MEAHYREADSERDCAQYVVCGSRGGGAAQPQRERFTRPIAPRAAFAPPTSRVRRNSDALPA